jgi:hypothetical protein
METIATSALGKSFSRPGNIDWPFLTFWLTYFSIIFGVGYAIL